MPCDLENADSYEDYIDISTKLNTLYREMNVVHFAAAGDFTASLAPNATIYEFGSLMITNYNCHVK
jgi:hypothetical protein